TQSGSSRGKLPSTNNQPAAGPMAIAYSSSIQRRRAQPETMRRVRSLRLNNVPATMFFRSGRISFAYRLASTSVGTVSVCLAGVLGAPSRDFFVDHPVLWYGLTLKPAPRQHNNHGKDEGRVRDERKSTKGNKRRLVSALKRACDSGL